MTTKRLPRPEKIGWSTLESSGPNRDLPVLVDMEGPSLDPASWSPAALATRLGEEQAPVAISATPTFDYSPEARGKDPGHLYRFETLPFSHAIAEMQEPSAGRYLYLMQVLVPPFLPALAGIAPRPAFLDEKLAKRSVWIGPDGTTTPLHFDRFGSLFSQLHGAKRVTLFAPGAAGRFEMFPVESATPHITAGRRPLMDSAGADFDFELQPGEALLLPPYWFHQVRNVGLSVSVHHWWACRIPGDLPANAGALVLHEFRRCRLRRLSWAACCEERPQLLDLAPLFLERGEAANAFLVIVAAMEWVIRGRAIRHQFPWPEAANFRDLLGAMKARELVEIEDLSWLEAMVDAGEEADRGCPPQISTDACRVYFDQAMGFARSLPTGAEG